MAEAAKIDDAAEKAYAAAAEKVVAKPEAVKPEAVKPAEVKPVEAKAPEAKAPEAKAPEAKAPEAKAATAKVEAPVAAKPVVAKKDTAPKAAKAPKAKKAAVKAAVKAVVEAPAKRKYVRKAVAVAKPLATPKAKPVAEIVRKSAAKITTPSTPSTLIAKLKETKMVTTTKKTADDMTAKIQDSVKDVQARARTAFEKSQALFGDAGEFTKGNLEAIVASGKILATGVQAMGKTYVAEVKSSIETVQADAKELRTVKSPSDFVKLQSTMMRKYFDNVVAYNSKSAEAALKLANEAFQPISSRVSLAVEKVKKAA